MPPAPDPSAPDLAAQLGDTVRDAILRHRPALLAGAGRLAGVTVELSLSKAGAIRDLHLYVEHASAHQVADRERRP